jgi:hypothetical protein
MPEMTLWSDFMTHQDRTIDKWTRYFPAYEEDQIAVGIGDQKDTKFIKRVMEEFATPDLVLDEGSRQMADVVASFRCRYPEWHQTKCM